MRKGLTAAAHLGKEAPAWLTPGLLGESQ